MTKKSDSAKRYFSNHPTYTAFIHVLGGIGIGILMTNPFFGVHPIRWAAVFIGASLIGHFYAYKTKG